MLHIAKHQLMAGLRDIKFLFMALIVLVVFVVNAFVFSAQYKADFDSWQDLTATTTRSLASKADNLQNITTYTQQLVKPPSAMIFISEGGERSIPNAYPVNAFYKGIPFTVNRGNETLWLIPTIDWAFIIGALMSLLCIVISFGAICGEKQDNTLSLLLSFPVSRMKLFLGKYLGLLFAVIITLVFCVFVNISLIYFLGDIPLTAEAFVNIGWVLLVSVLFLSLNLLFGMFISSITKVKSVSLILLLVVWIFAVVVIPGASRMVAEEQFEVNSRVEMMRIYKEKMDELLKKGSKTGGINGPRAPFGPRTKIRMDYVVECNAAEEAIIKFNVDQKIRQTKGLQSLAAISPYGLLKGTFEQFTGTGVTGFENLEEMTSRYKNQLLDFARNKDKQDKDSPHWVYAWSDHAEEGTFSTKPIDPESFPRFESLWLKGGLMPDTTIPWFQILVFLALNIQFALLGILAITKYDPR